MKLLIIEDDQNILSYLEKGFKEEGYIVDICDNGSEGLYLAQTCHYDAIIADWMLPEMNGLNICLQLRIQKITTPFLILTAKSDVEDKIKGLECGADDYLTKPFSFGELVARVHALIRRHNFHDSEMLTLDTLHVNLLKRTVMRGNTPIELTTKEFDILVFMLGNQNTIISHTMLQEKIWGISEITSSNVINVFIYHLRKKIDIAGEKPLIKTIRGSGYKLCSN
ncbi:MAG: response regulator transcription factor [Sulfurospirillum sp.]|nr:response regulator transcription factor [Sulfurospirillum sp.]